MSHLEGLNFEYWKREGAQYMCFLKETVLGASSTERYSKGILLKNLCWDSTFIYVAEVSLPLAHLSRGLIELGKIVLAWW